MYMRRPVEKQAQTGIPRVLVFCMVMGAALSALSAPVAQAAIITFDNLPAGSFIGSQYFASDGMIIAAQNARASGPDVATLINSDISNPQDRDLEYNWDVGNLRGVREKNLLIIAENVVTNSSGYIKSPDDERDGGRIIASFSRPLSAFGFDLLDMEAENASLSSIQFYSGGVLVATVPFSQFTTPASPYYDSSVVWSDNNSGNRIKPITAASLGVVSFNAIAFDFNTSHAVDRFNYTSATSVPEPSTASVLLVVAWMSQCHRGHRSQRRA